MSLTATETIVVLSTPGCQRCKFVERYLDDKGVTVTHIDLSLPENSEWLALFRERNLTNVPQTVSGETWVEGVDLDSINRLF
jgi:glutaredoxin